MRTVWMALLLAVTLVPALSGCASGRAQWLARGDRPAFGRMIADARQARAVFVGEFHDQREHHDLQLDVIKALKESRTPLAIGLEMFDMDSQPVLDRWVRGEVELTEFMAFYLKNWTISWAEYDTILLFARNYHIPLIALNAPTELVRKVSRKGFDSLSEDERFQLPAGVTGTVSRSYRAFLQDAFADHGMDDGAFESFCQAQALRNSTMGSLIGSYLKHNPERTMVVITGVGHAMRRAVADDLGKGAALTTRIIIPVTDGLFDRIGRDDADFFVYP